MRLTQKIFYKYILGIILIILIFGIIRYYDLIKELPIIGLICSILFSVYVSVISEIIEYRLSLRNKNTRFEVLKDSVLSSIKNLKKHLKKEDSERLEVLLDELENLLLNCEKCGNSETTSTLNQHYQTINNWKITVEHMKFESEFPVEFASLNKDINIIEAFFKRV